jgi:glyoxylase-like metal-dependent hydrolase (beta-lactamase superfamily II)
VVSADPILVHAANPSLLTGRGNNTWLLDGEQPALIDAGVGAPEHVDTITRVLGDRPLAVVLVTHGHADHASGVPALRARWPRVEAFKWLAGSETGWRPLEDGQTVRAGNTQLTVIHTPGHASDHVCFWNAADRQLYSGDMVLAGTTVMIPAGHGGNLRQYLASLDLMARLGAVRIYPGHGPIIDRPAEIIEEYLVHRQLRERQVLACLNEGIVDIEAIVSRIYPNLADGLRPAARLTIGAHLEKLREEGRA